MINMVDVSVVWTRIADASEWFCDRCGKCGGECCGFRILWRRGDSDYCLCTRCRKKGDVSS